MQPLVNVLIPVFNQNPRFLRECISSAIHQTYPNLQIIVSNNHSTADDTNRVIHELCDGSAFIRLISPPAHLSMVAHFQFILQHADAEWVTFLSSDDFLHPDFVQISVSSLLASQGDPAFSYCLTSFYSEEESRVVSTVRPRPHGFASQTETLRRFLTGKEGSFCGLLVKTSALRAFDPFPTWLSYAGDLYAFIQLAKHHSSFFINQSLATCRLHQRYEQNARLADCIQDLSSIYSAVANDSLIVSLVGEAYINCCLQTLLQYWIYVYKSHRFDGSLPLGILASAKMTILSIDSSILTRCILAVNNHLASSLLLKIRSLLTRVPMWA